MICPKCNRIIANTENKQKRFPAQIAANDEYVFCIDDDGIMWTLLENTWRELPALPDKKEKE